MAQTATQRAREWLATDEGNMAEIMARFAAQEPLAQLGARVVEILRRDKLCGRPSEDLTDAEVSLLAAARSLGLLPADGEGVQP